MSHGIPSKIESALKKIWVWIALSFVLIIVSLIVVSMFPGLSEENIKSNIDTKFTGTGDNNSFFNFPTPGSFHLNLLGSSTGIIAKPIVRPYENQVTDDNGYIKDYNGDNSWDIDMNFWNQEQTNWNEPQTDWKAPTNWGVNAN